MPRVIVIVVVAFVAAMLNLDGPWWSTPVALATAQPLYTWTDENGVAHYTADPWSIPIIFPISAEYAARARDGWKEGETRDSSQDMMRLTLAIVAKTLFDADA